MNYLARIRFDPTATTAHSSQLGDLFLPPSTHAVDSPSPDSPNSVPQDGIRVLHYPNKHFRISDFTKENILPENERRKEVQTRGAYLIISKYGSQSSVPLKIAFFRVELIRS